MNESYAEAGVKRIKTTSSYIAKAGIIFVVILIVFFGAAFLGPYAAVFAFLAIAGCYYLFQKFNVEYEYIYCDGQFDFDRITNNSKRKNMLKIDSDKIEMIAPVKSHALDSYNHMQVTVKNFSSLDPQAKVYAIIYHAEKDNMKILFEPNDTMLACIKQKTPRKLAEY